MKGKRVGILMGGMSAESDVSIKRAMQSTRALTARGYIATKGFVDRDIDQMLRQEPIRRGVHCATWILR